MIHKKRARQSQFFVPRDVRIKIRGAGERVALMRKIADMRDDATDRGKIGFQVHAGEDFKNMKMIVRSIAILAC